MTNQEQIIEAEKAIEFYKQVIESNKEHLKTQEAKLSNLKKQPEPKEGEWGYGEFADLKWVAKTTNISGGYWHFSEGYYSDGDLTRNGFQRVSQFIRPATNDEITYFMGLHAERLGIKEGVTVDRSGLKSNLRDKNKMLVSKFNYLEAPEYKFYKDGEFAVFGSIVKDSHGTWATVVKEKPVKNGKLKAKIAKLETENGQLKQKLEEERTKNINYLTTLETIKSQTIKHLG